MFFSRLSGNFSYLSYIEPFCKQDLFIFCLRWTTVHTRGKLSAQENKFSSYGLVVPPHKDGHSEDWCDNANYRYQVWSHKLVPRALSLLPSRKMERKVTRKRGQWIQKNNAPLAPKGPSCEKSNNYGVEDKWIKVFKILSALKMILSWGTSGIKWAS